VGSVYASHHNFDSSAVEQIQSIGGFGYTFKGGYFNKCSKEIDCLFLHFDCHTFNFAYSLLTIGSLLAMGN